MKIGNNKTGVNEKKNLIYTPFAFKDNTKSGENIKGNIFSVYLKNACVALCSAKYYNPECDVALVTNISLEHIPQEYIDILKKFNVIIMTIPYDTFVFNSEYLWSLAFYKLCVLKYLSGSNYKNICYMDTDVYVQNNMGVVWKECEYNILMYDINHGLHVGDYISICEEFERYGGKKQYLTHYGGEFFAASTVRAREFITVAESVYNEMIDRNFITTKGDEFIVSLAAERMKQNVKNAGAYVFRFWTGPSFRLVSSCYQYNAITVLHLPAEKQRGMLKIYQSYVSKGKIPDNHKVWKICRLKRRTMIDVIAITLKTILKR